MRNLICRTCMVKCVPVGGQAFVNMFEMSEHNKLLSDMLCECAALKVEKNDGLPQYICNGCKEKLTSAWSFRAVAIESNAKLRNPYIDRERAVLKSVESGGECVKQETTTAQIKLEDVDVPADDRPCGDVCEEEEPISIEEPELRCCDAEMATARAMEDPLRDTEGGENGANSVDDEYLETVPSEEEDSQSSIVSSDSEQSSREEEEEQEEENGNGVSDNKPVETVPLLLLDTGRNCEKRVEDGKGEIASGDSDPDENIVESLAEIEEANVSITDKEARPISLLAALEFPRKKRRELNARCKICDRSFSLLYYYEVHAHHHTGNKRFECEQCGKRFMWRYQFKIHGRVHTDERPFACELCGKTFKFRGALASHAFVHSEERPHKCDECEKRFKSTVALAAHKRTHGDEKAKVCEECGKAYTGASAFRKHRETHDGGGGGTHPCPVCGKRYAHRDQMRKHHRQHTGERRHKCERCDETFWDKSVRDAHMRRHTGEKPYGCEICDKRFRHPSTLYNHKRVHTGETPFRCALCPAEFKYSHHLKNHTHKSHPN